MLRHIIVKLLTGFLQFVKRIRVIFIQVIIQKGKQYLLGDLVALFYPVKAFITFFQPSINVFLPLFKASDPVQSELAEKIYAELSEAGIEPLYDDRDERAGVKFKDMELIGIPMRITVGKLAGENKVEFRGRTDSENTVMSVEEAIAKVKELCR